MVPPSDSNAGHQAVNGGLSLRYGVGDDLAMALR